MPKFKPLVQLHNHSKYSLLDAVPSPEEWVEWCLKTKTPGFAVTDHGTAISMFHATRFPEYIEKYNKENKTNYPKNAVTGIPAVELYVKLNAEDRSHYHITCWATSNEGYYNLMKLASLAYDDQVNYYGNIKARVTFDQIKQYKAGIKFGTGCIAGPIGKCIFAGDIKLAEERFLMYKELFGDDLYIEFHPHDVDKEFNKKTGGFDQIQPNECSCDGNMQKAYNLFLRDMVDKYGGKCIPVTDAHFILPEDKVLQDCVLKAGNSNGWYFAESYHQIESDEIFDMLKHHLGDWLTEEKYASWIDNTYEVMEAAKSIDIKTDFHLPKIQMPKNIEAQTNDYNEQTYHLLMEKIKEHKRWNDSPEYVARFNLELDVIWKNKVVNFLPYFLVYEDICNYARSQGILQNIGRGSAGGSLISYYLKIIHVDPIKAKLPFERFLSHARINGGSFPDIDCDFGQREPVLKYLQGKYNLGFAQVATFTKMKTKNAIKDAMWATYGRNRNDPEVKHVCDSIPNSPQGIDEHDFLYGYTDEEGHTHLGQVEVNKTLANFFKTYPGIEQMVIRLLGIVRGFGRHPSAYVVSSIDLSSQRVPTMMMKDPGLGKIQVTQFDAKMCEESGLVKADILRVNTIEDVSGACALIKELTGIDYLEEDDKGVQAIYRLPEDPAVYKDFYDKKTDSSFQFNTPLIKGYVQQFNPTEREHLSAMTALARPGTLDAPFSNDEISIDDGVSAAQYYMDVRGGKRKLSYLHPDLIPITSTTYGVITYQEQVMQFLVDICGYTWETADRIRNAISKKKSDVIMATYKDIRIACAARGWTEEQIQTICEQIQAFSRYSFNRSHSYCYGELGYITMYLKHHHRLEWWTSVLNNAGSEDKLRKFIALLGDTVKPPSLRAPSNKFIIFEGNIVAPLSVVKGVGPAAIDELIKKGPFNSLEEYIAKVNHSKANSGHFGHLVKARVADSLMRQDVPYGEARTEFLNTYKTTRKCKIKEELYETDPLRLFVAERDANTTFNKHVLADKAIVDLIKAKKPDWLPTNSPGCPFKVKNHTGDIAVLGNIKVATGFVEKRFDREVGMVMLYTESVIKSGISKKSGRPYRFLTINMSDGFNEMECTWFDKTASLRLPVNSLVYIKGVLKEGWKTPVSMTITELEPLIVLESKDD
jgi:DNA polymerase III subunit alpha